MRFYPTREQFRQSWEKYGLIVVGNIVFFALLYFISYRPNNDENRAAEFLAMAQAEETAGRREAAMVLYEKVLADYPETAAAGTAQRRLPEVRQGLAAAKVPSKVAPELDLESMLARRPSVYVATFLASHWDDAPRHRAKIREAIERYLWIAVNVEGVDHRTLRREAGFQAEHFQRELFDLRPGCVMEADLLWDDFSVRNANFYAWTNAVIAVTVEQGGRRESIERRVEQVAPGDAVDMLEFRVKGAQGTVSCAVEVVAEEGTATVAQRM